MLHVQQARPRIWSPCRKTQQDPNFINTFETALPIRLACARLLAAGVNSSLLPVKINDFWTFFAKSTDDITSFLQRKLSQCLHAKTYKALMQAANRTEKHRITSAKINGAGLWLTTFPSCPELKMTASVMSFAARLRIGVPIADVFNSAGRCKCDKVSFASEGKYEDDTPVDKYHCFSCDLLKRNAIFWRHEKLLALICKFARIAGAVPAREPLIMGKRPDLCLSLNEFSMLSDVAVKNPICPSWVAQNPTPKEFGYGAVAERQKTKKYEKQTTEMHATFAPFVLELLGGLGLGAKRILFALAEQHCDSFGLVNHKDFLLFLQRAVSCCLVKGNALCVINCLGQNQIRGRLGGLRRP